MMWKKRYWQKIRESEDFLANHHDWPFFLNHCLDFLFFYSDFIRRHWRKADGGMKKSVDLAGRLP
ncbi:hypothetical protein HAT88_03917 [Dickeya solani]|nr:hypothetical protein [Dickeya solani]NUA54759.1 hypothetical protein [Dickeya solani]